jgi:hypothetical protein
MASNTSRRFAALALVTGIILGAGTPSAQAKIKCWKNHEGVQECGNAVPPEFAQKSIERKSSMGLTVEKTERAKTQEELAAARAEAERIRKEKLEADWLAAEQARKDRVLLQTFTTEEDLRLATDGKIAVIDSRVKHSEQLAKKLGATRDELQGEAAQYERRGKKVPTELTKKIDDIQLQIDNNRAQISLRNEERLQVQQQYETDLARYRELKGG